jgi:predicted ABC-type transport system involved in lysophospholipase L1 biosynthesis ATPase subunit
MPPTALASLTISPDETRLLVFLACIVVAMAGGYLARRSGLLRIEWAGSIMSAAIVLVDAPVALFALWLLHIDRGITLVVITHDPGIGQQCQRIIRIMDGQVVKEEQHEKVA